MTTMTMNPLNITTTIQNPNPSAVRELLPLSQIPYGAIVHHPGDRPAMVVYHDPVSKTLVSLSDPQATWTFNATGTNQRRFVVIGMPKSISIELRG